MSTGEIILLVGGACLVVGVLTYTISPTAWFPKDKMLYKYLLTSMDKIQPEETGKGLVIKLYDVQVAINGGEPIYDCFIGVYDIPIVCKYYINCIGPIPRWYRSHRFLQKIYRAKVDRNRKTRKQLMYEKTFGRELP